MAVALLSWPVLLLLTLLAAGAGWVVGGALGRAARALDEGDPVRTRVRKTLRRRLLRRLFGPSRGD